MDTCETVKVVAKDVPGGHIVINKEDLTKDHVLLSGEDVVKGAGNAKLTVAELRDALSAAGIAFDDTAKKADLQALLDAGKPE
jgi:hypothetical protein